MLGIQTIRDKVFVSSHDDIVISKKANVFALVTRGSLVALLPCLDACVDLEVN